MELFDEIINYNSGANLEEISKSFEYFQEKNEDDENLVKVYFLIKNLVRLKTDDETLIAGILSELYLNGKMSNDQVKKRFGSRVLALLISLKSLKALRYSPNDRDIQVEVLRKMFLTMAKDLRVILIWLCERLFVMENLDGKDKGLQTKFARKTMNLYVPIASRLGVYRLKTQLEDLSFKYIDRFNYDKINGEVESFGVTRKKAIERVIKNVEDFFGEHGIRANVSGRIKSAHSIFKKLKEKNLNSIDKLYDIFAVRVILENKIFADQEVLDHLYSTIGLLHSKWRPVPGRFKDYVSVPKPNGYRSLHTVLLGLAPKDLDRPVEVQVRTSAMHAQAEFGVASHWIYKDTGKSEGSHIQSKVDWLQGLKQIDEMMKSDNEVVRQVDIGFFNDRIFVLTPRGEVKDLPVSSIPIDFAYSVHTELGHKCVMAKVNDNVVPLDYKLQNGDVVDIVTKDDAGPKLRWLSLVGTAGARTKIKAWFNKQNSQEFLKEGRKLVNEWLERNGKATLSNTYSILKNYGGKELNVSERENVLEEIGKGAQMAHDVLRKIFPPAKEEREEKVETVLRDEENFLSSDAKVVVGGEEGLPIRIPACCKPKVSDKIIAYVTRGNSLTIHKANCNLLDDLDDRRMFVASWKD